MYVYSNHRNGNFYISDKKLDCEDLYCEVCGDADVFIGFANTRKDA